MSTSIHIDRITPGSRQALIDSTEAHIARGHLSHCAPGSASPGDASFPGHFGRRSDVRPGAADTVAVSMEPEPIGPRFLEDAEALLEAIGIEPHRFGRQAQGDPAFVLRLSRRRSPTLQAFDRVRAFMAADARTVEREAVRAAVEEETEMDGNTGYVKTKEAAALVGLSHRTLETYRSRGGGPPYSLLGRSVRYLPSLVLTWAAERCRRSTSDDGLKDPAPEDGDDDDDGTGNSGA